MPLSPKVARFLPTIVRDFCDGLLRPHAFLIIVPLFFLALIFSPYLPASREVILLLALLVLFTGRSH